MFYSHSILAKSGPFAHVWLAATWEKVVGLLRDQLDAAESLSFDAFTAGANKRSAVGVFVELLHLKTWDFVQLDQPAAYGDIAVSKAAHFHDAIPQAVAA